jgi:hypothetical protein
MTFIQPTVDNPLILNIHGHVPALKNEKLLKINTKSGKPVLLSNADVKVFIERVRSTYRPQFDVIPFPVHVAVYAEFWFFVANQTNIAASDGDNAYTTLQELLQKPKKNAPYLHIMDDDKQVTAHHVETYAVRDAAQEGARLFIWAMSEDHYQDRDAMWDACKRFRQTYRQQTANQVNLDFDEILTLLP